MASSVTDHQWSSKFHINTGGSHHLFGLAAKAPNTHSGARRRGHRENVGGCGPYPRTSPLCASPITSAMLHLAEPNVGLRGNPIPIEAECAVHAVRVVPARFSPVS